MTFDMSKSLSALFLSDLIKLTEDLSHQNFETQQL